MPHLLGVSKYSHDTTLWRDPKESAKITRYKSQIIELIYKNDLETERHLTNISQNLYQDLTKSKFRK